MQEGSISPFCPNVAVYDLAGTWNMIECGVQSKTPLKNIAWKSPFSGSIISIESLPIRFAKCEKMSFSPQADWYKAPYAHVCIVACENIDDYKRSIRQEVQQWIDYLTSQMEEEWLVLYTPNLPTRGSPFQKHHTKVYGKLSQDFLQRHDGDRTCMLPACSDSSFGENDALVEGTHLSQRWQDWMSKLRQTMITSIHRRCQKYDAEIRRLDAQRGSEEWDFASLFLAKEGLAFVYQQLQLPAEGLLQYDELNATLGALPWPTSIHATGTGPVDKETRKELDQMSMSVHYAASVPEVQESSFIEVSDTSIRTLVTEKIISVFELRKYIFSRQINLLLSLGKPGEAASRTLKFSKQLKAELIALSWDEESRKKVELLVFKVCWDVAKAASSVLYANSSLEAENIRDYLSASRAVCDLAEAGRQRLLAFGRSTGIVHRGLLSKLQHNSYAPQLKNWLPTGTGFSQENIRTASLKQVVSPQKNLPNEASNPSTSDDSLEIEPMELKIESPDPAVFITVDYAALSEDQHFESTYFLVSKAVAQQHLIARRQRLAFHLFFEQAQLLMLQGMFEDALFILCVLKQRYEELSANWAHIKLWLLRALAQCQFELCMIESYIGSLLELMHPDLSAIAPKCTSCFMNEIKSVLRSGQVQPFSRQPWPLLDAHFVFSWDDIGEPKKVAQVGQSYKVVINLISAFPETVEFDMFTLQVKQTTLLSKPAASTDEDYHDIQLTGPMGVQPGPNILIMEVIPWMAGTLKVECFSIIWGNLTFVERAKLPETVVPVTEPQETVILEIKAPKFLPLGQEGYFIVTIQSNQDLSNVLLSICSSEYLRVTSSIAKVKTYKDRLKQQSDLIRESETKVSTQGLKSTIPLSSLDPCSTTEIYLSFAVSVFESRNQQSLLQFLEAELHFEYAEIKESLKVKKSEQNIKLQQMINVGLPFKVKQESLIINHLLNSKKENSSTTEQAIYCMCLQSKAPVPITIQKAFLELPKGFQVREHPSNTISGTILHSEQLLTLSFSVERPKKRSNDRDQEGLMFVLDYGMYDRNIDMTGQYKFRHNCSACIKRDATLCDYPVSVDCAISAASKGSKMVLGGLLSITFKISFEELFSLKFCSPTTCFGYEVSYLTDQWMVCGKVKGKLKSQGNSPEVLKFEAVPLQCGDISSPALIIYAPSNSDITHKPKPVAQQVLQVRYYGDTHIFVIPKERISSVFLHMQC